MKNEKIVKCVKGQSFLCRGIKSKKNEFFFKILSGMPSILSFLIYEKNLSEKFVSSHKIQTEKREIRW